jgi:DNA ligase (NAD+)
MLRSILLRGLLGVLVGGIWFATAAPDTSIGSIGQNDRSDSDVPLLNPAYARRRIADLRTQIAHHDALYFQKATPEITDAVYDALKRELRTLENAFPAEAAIVAQPPAIAEDHTEGFAKAVHRVPMASLDKAYTEAELRAFCSKVATTLGRPATFVVEPKIDGLSVSATYEHGRFIRACTRGNGLEGDDITANARALRSLPLELRATTPDGTPNVIPDLIELRGEIYLSLAEFMRLNRERFAEGEPQLAHPRNVASGTIKSQDPSETAERHLDVVFYGWGIFEPASAAPTTQQAFHAQAKVWGLPVLETYQVVHNSDEAWAAVQALGQKRATLIAPTDGAVLKIDDVAARAQFGESDHAPRWAIAYKYPPECGLTQLRAITIQVGRTGLLTPVAELAPIALGGSTLSRATLHNRDQIARLDLRVGDFVFLEKAGEIIPEILGVDPTKRKTSSDPYAFPEKCPACGTAVVADQDAAAVRCPNAACPAQLQRRIAHFVGKTGVAIKGFGETTIAELIASGNLRALSDIYRLKLKDLEDLPSPGIKSADALLAEIQRSRHSARWRFINGLSTPHVGPASAKILAQRFESLERLAAAQPIDLPAELGGAASQAVLTFFSAPENRAIAIELSRAVQPSAPATSDSNLSGKVFVLTGRLPTLSREETTRRIEAAGGKVRESVSISTDYVVAGTDPGEKLVNAKNLNVSVLDEDELLELLEDYTNVP